MPYAVDMSDTGHTARLEARVPSRVLDMIRRAAELRGISVTSFVIEATAEKAGQVIEQMESIRLTREEQARFAEALLNPPEPTEALRDAAKRHRDLVASKS
jgi:uncharacterized protein (DUF1778 family)